MKTNLPSHINNWSFTKNKKESFFIKYDVFIIVFVFIVGYLIIF